MVEENHDSDRDHSWYLDSGATQHMTWNGENIKNAKITSVALVAALSNQETKAKQVGTVSLHCQTPEVL